MAGAARRVATARPRLAAGAPDARGIRGAASAARCNDEARAAASHLGGVHAHGGACSAHRALSEIFAVGDDSFPASAAAANPISTEGIPAATAATASSSAAAASTAAAIVDASACCEDARMG